MNSFSERKSLTIVIGLVALVLTACGGGGGESPAAASASAAASTSSIASAIAMAETSGALPVLNRDTSVAGTDTNGVRGDVKAYIDALPDTPTQKLALIQHASALQNAMLTDTTSQSAVNTASARLMNAVVCLHASYPAGTSSQKGKDIQKITVNTVTRLAAYEKFNSALSGTTIKVPTGGGCGQ